jgi:hypothetical protein
LAESLAPGRMDYPGAIHQVMSRGDRREDVFLNDAGR